MLLFYDIDRKEQSSMQAVIEGKGDTRLPYVEIYLT